ncbi:hypothetical protein A6S26_27480 [Nostoc sp. ATCC 43529]|nr:hypothetical protein A6S26_27480 [Nostoc sp. ATCC 43529]
MEATTVKLNLNMDTISSDRKADTEELQKLVGGFLNAFLTNDVALVEQELPDDFLGIVPDGRVINKALEIENVKSVALESLNTDQVKIYWYGDTVAIINFCLSIKLKGQDAVEVRDSHVYMKRDGRWQMIMGHATPILQPWVLSS